MIITARRIVLKFNFKSKKDIRNLTLSAMFLALAFELATYGFLAGWLYNKLPKKKVNVYVSLLITMVVGRLVWSVVMFGCMGLDPSKFGLSAFLTGAVLNAVLGIVVQIILIPILVITLEKLVNKSK